MIEPTETESKETLDLFIEVMHEIAREAAEDPDVDAVLTNMGMALRFAPYEENEALMRGQQESLVTICQELGLAQ